MEKTYKIKREIKRLKKEKNAVILAHVYQIGDVQDIADYTGDSLDLSRKATSTNADVIVFCGVRFMAETAYLLNPAKTVLLPDENACCGLADMATVEQLKSKKKEYPDAAVVSYVNSSAAIKAESDICCTSANAIDVINSLHHDQILFLPDRNLGGYIAECTGKKNILWEGFCYVHENIKLSQLRKLKKTNPEAEIIVHPECTTPVRHFADFIGSTSQMSRYVAQAVQK
jgi:quinolinate synthase